MSKFLITKQRGGLWARLAALMVVLMMTTAQLNAQVAEIVGGETYQTVQAAVNAATAGQTVQMLANSTENVSVASGKTVTLDLNGFVLNQSTDNNGVIVSSGNLTIKDSDASKTNYFTYISNGAWTYLPDHTPAATDVPLADIGTATLVSGETVISVPGGCITGGKATSYGGGVKVSGGSVTLQSGNIIGNSVPNGSSEWKGGGVSVNSGTFNMQGGVIAGNNAYTGGGVQINGTLNMTGGKIIANSAGLGGGVNNDGTIIMTGGEIAYNNGGCGGVRGFGTKTVGGTARIINNKDGGNTSNFVVCNGTISVSTPLTNGANIGVTPPTAPTVGNPVAVTSNCAASDVQYFKSDNAAYAPIYDDSKVKLAVIGSNVCKIVETGNMFETVAAAITAAGNDQTVQMLANSTENVSVASGKTVTLDLNGFVLNQSTDNNGVIVSSGNLTIKDSDASKTNYFTYMSNGAWTYLPDHTPAATDVALADIGTATLTSGETVISVPGGCITGGKATGYGGGVKVSGGSVTLQSGNIIGNSVPNGSGEWKGGGVCVCVNSGTFNMQGGVIAGNNAYTGGGVQINGTLNMTGGKIIANSAGLGGGVNNDGTIIMTGGEIAYNSGGCGGVRGFGTKTVGGTARIINNKDGGNTSNFVVCNGTITVSSTTPLTNGAIIGVTAGTPTIGNPVAVTGDNSESVKQYFTSDNGSLFVIEGVNKAVQLAVPVAQIGDDRYATVQAAIDAAEDGQTVQMLNNTTESVTMASKKAITLDLNGKTIASKDKGTVIANNGTLTVIDSSDGNGIIKGAETGAGIVNSSTGTLNLYAGEVKDNVRGVDNGGTLTLGGKVLITSNGTDTTKDNLYMRDNTTFSIATGDYAPAKTMHIGITTETAPTANNDIPLTDANENYLDYSKHFFGDNSAYTVFYNDTDKKLYLTNDVTIIVTADPAEGGEAQLLVTATGEPVEDPEHIHYNTSVTIKAIPTKDWAFKGWYDKSTGNMFSGKFEYTFNATKSLELEARFTDQVIWVRVKKGN